MLPSISYYFFDTLFGFVLLQNLSRDESKAEASHYYTSIYPVCWLALAAVVVIQWFVTPYFHSVRFHHHLFYALLFTAHKSPPTSF